MAKSSPSSPAPGDDEQKKIADANWLMSEASKAKPKPKSAPPGPGPGGSPAEEDHSYDLAEGPDEPFDFGDPAVPPIPAPGEPAVGRKRKLPKLDAGWEAEAEAESGVTEAAKAEFVEEAPTVEHVWSRGAEWG